MSQTPITPALVRQALACISAALPRDEWAKVGMAIKSEYGDGTGLELFDDWSQSAGDAYNAKAVQETWRSIKAGGGVTIATLLAMAKAGGFDIKAHAPANGVAADEAKAQKSKRIQRQQDDEVKRQTAQARAAQEAARLWDAAAPDGASPYLERKGVLAHGLRFMPDGVVLMPLRDGNGQLWNVQRIYPQALPGSNSNKLFIKGARKSGLWHMLGDAAGAGVLQVAEGYATAATVHEATGWPAVCALDAGNLAHVAKALHQLYPAALLVLCGDDDLATLARTGRNPGREKATAAARAVQGVAVFPRDLPAEGSDFNDMAQAVGSGAVGALLREVVDAALAASAKRSHKPARAFAAGAGADAEAVDPFIVDDDGVWHQGMDNEGKRKPLEWVCSRLDVPALTRDVDGNSWGYLLAFADPLGKPKQWAMPARMLSGDGGEYRAWLLNMGLRLAASARARNLLTQYIQTRQPGKYATSTDRVGWHGHAFVLPHKTIGDEAQRVVYQTDGGGIENTISQRGTLEQWREGTGALCAGNSRLVFAVSCAFAAPLLRPMGMESGGFHFRGDSSSGKTTALRVAASVYGGSNFMQRWRSTDNALEATAAAHSDLPLMLDELAQVDPKTAGECAYLLANEQSKARSSRSSTLRPRLTWRLLFLSAGELGLADHMAEGMKRVRTGQEVRMADIPADAGRGLGLFEYLHGMASGADLARTLTQRSAAIYGTAGDAWLHWLTRHAETLRAVTRQRAGALAGQWMPAGAGGQVERVCARFALVAAAGEMATEAGLTGWDAGESISGVKACFDAWLAARGGVGNSEVTNMLRQVRRFFEAHGEGRFTWWHRAADDHATKTLSRAGFRRLLTEDGIPIKCDSEHGREFGEKMPSAMGERVSVEYFVLPEAFRSEVCQGYDYVAVAQVLLEHDCLKPGAGRRYDDKQRLPGMGPSRCYRITKELFEMEI